jgi:hypothetical protein
VNAFQSSYGMNNRHRLMHPCQYPEVHTLAYCFFLSWTCLGLYESKTVSHLRIHFCLKNMPVWFCKHKKQCFDKLVHKPWQLLWLPCYFYVWQHTLQSKQGNLIRQVSVKMRYYGTISKCCIFIVCKDSLLFNQVYKRFDWRIRYCTAGRGTWFSKNTNQIVKGMKTCRVTKAQ